MFGQKFKTLQIVASSADSARKITLEKLPNDREFANHQTAKVRVPQADLQSGSYSGPEPLWEVGTFIGILLRLWLTAHSEVAR